MRYSRLLRAALFLFAILLVATLAWLTLPASEDPCAEPQMDISAAVLAGSPDDQEALINRAIIVRENCEKKQD
jgi:hypothetical protein